MTDRIDHAAEAVNFLGATSYDTYGDDDRKVALAQVHATLALVEQQRAANRIALASVVAESSRASGMHGSVVGLIVKDVGLFRYPETPDGAALLHDDIREALGLS